MNHIHEKTHDSVDLPFADLDLDRLARRGVAEVIFGEGKQGEEVAQIMARLFEVHGRALATRITEDTAQFIKSYLSQRLSEAHQFTYNSHSRVASIGPRMSAKCRGTILVVSAGTSDGPVASEAYDILHFLGCLLYTSDAADE